MEPCDDPFAGHPGVAGTARSPTRDAAERWHAIAAVDQPYVEKL